MQRKARPIAPLPARTASHLRSSVMLPSLPSILTELIQNSLDASATKIDCSVDLTRWTLACHDNGHGIPWSDLKRLGRERYWTSKLGGGEGQGGKARAGAGIEVGEVDTFGFRGEAMASMADVGVVEVLTKPVRANEDSYELLVSGGKTVSVAKAAKDRVGIGTSVWVRDIFANYPVRRRPLAVPSAQGSLIAFLRQAITTLALIHPHVSFSLTDLSQGDPSRVVSVARSSEGVLGRWRQMWGRAGVEKVAAVEDTDVKGEISLYGFFSLTASHSKGSQYIYVNSRPLSPSPLHKLINVLFASSTFARHASSHLIAPNSPTPSQQRLPPGEQPALPDPEAQPHKRFRATPKKVTERHPIFVLRLDLPFHMVDVTLEPEKRAVEFVDEERVMGFVGEAVRAWLRGQGFLGEGHGGEEMEELPPAQSAREPLSDEEPTPVKRAREGLTRFLSPHGPLSPRPGTPVRARELGMNAVSSAPVPTRSLGRCPVVTPTRPRTPAQQPEAVQGTNEILIDARATEPVRWVDPASGEVVMIDPRTGNSWRAGQRPGEAAAGSARAGPVVRAREPGTSGARVLVDRSRLRKALPREGEPVPPPPEWMANALERWVNPVFPSAPPPIPCLSPVAHDDCHPTDDDGSPPPGLPPWLYKAGITRARTKQMDAFFRNSTRVDVHHLLGEVGSQRVTRAGLQRARFIAQVERKFLLVAVPAEGADEGATGGGGQGETLVMVDQHAADERVRVERIWEGVAGKVARGEEVERHVLEPPAGVVVSREEAAGLRDGGKREQFARWGVDLALEAAGEGAAGQVGSDGEGEQDYVQVWLRTVPKVVAGRLKVEPKLRQELVRSYLGDEYAAGAGRRGGAVGAGEATAAAALRECPPVLVELMNSLACRGAIMFNDALSRRQGEALLRKLARTRFPFQCAHGRPTLQPVVNLPQKGPGRAAARPLDWGALDGSGTSAPSEGASSRTSWMEG